MYKCLIFIGVSLLVSEVNAQADLDFYKVHELNITNLNKLTASEEVDFGYNYSNNKAKEIELGYYLWVEDAWYKVVNANEIFIANDISPIFFTTNRFNKTDLKIKDQLGVVYSYPIESIESYKLSNVLYSGQLKEYSEAKAVADLEDAEIVILGNDEANQPPQIKTLPETKSSPEVNEIVLTEPTLAEKLNDVVQVQENLNATEKDTIKNSVILDVEDFSVSVVKKIVPFDVSKNEEIIVEDGKDLVTEVSQNSDTVVVSNQEIIDTPLVNEKEKTVTLPKNDYEKAVLEGFDGSVTEWIESIDSLGGKTAYQQALEKGFKGTEQEWLRSLWGSNVDPVIEKQNKIAGIVTQWINDLGNSNGYSPYDLALKHGFYGSYTEWIESVIGKNGEEVYSKEVEAGFSGTYKEWIEEKLKISNDEVLRKEALIKSNFVMVPNLQIPVSSNVDEILEFDLFDYYAKYYGNSVISSSGNNSKKISVLNSDLEYQITWFNSNDIDIKELSPNGILKYQSVKMDTGDKTSINVRFILK